MSDAVRAASVAPTDMVVVLQGNGIVLATVAQINGEPDARCAALEGAVATLTARLAASDAAAVSLAQRVATLEGRPDPCVALSGALPVATLQVGSTDVAVPVVGLLPTDRVAVELLADVPAGLVLGAMRPDPARPGVLLVQATATLSMSGKAALPLAITALR